MVPYAFVRISYFGSLHSLIVFDSFFKSFTSSRPFRLPLCTSESQTLCLLTCSICPSLDFLMFISLTIVRPRAPQTPIVHFSICHFFICLVPNIHSGLFSSENGSREDSNTTDATSLRCSSKEELLQGVLELPETEATWLRDALQDKLPTLFGASQAQEQLENLKKTLFGSADVPNWDPGSLQKELEAHKMTKHYSQLEREDNAA